MAQNATAGATGGHSYAFGLGYLLLCFNALGWGLNFPVLKLGLAFSAPMLFTCMRMALGTLAMFIIAGLLGVLRLPRRGDLPVLLSVGVLQNMAFITLVTLGVQYLPAGRAAKLRLHILRPGNQKRVCVWGVCVCVFRAHVSVVEVWWVGVHLLVC